MTQNQIAYRNYVEGKRHNLEMERLTGEKQAEDARHYKAVEEETARHQKSVESETARSNMEHESISREQNAINQVHYQSMDSETRRHDQTTEKIQLLDVNGQNKLRTAQADEAYSKVAVNYEQAEYIKGQTANLPGENLKNLSYVDLNYASVQEKLASANLKTAQTDSTKIQTQYAPSLTKSQIVSNYAKSIKDVSSEIRNWLRSGSTTTLKKSGSGGQRR